jgi:hypothetical protein
MPRKTEKEMTAFSSFSEPNFFSNHVSNLDGFASSSSGKNSAEYMSALTPATIESPKFTTPRMSGQPSQGFLSLVSFSSSTLVTMPSGPRTTMDCFSGPRMRMPSMSA